MKAAQGRKAAALLGSLIVSVALSACNAEVTGPQGMTPPDWLGPGGTSHTDDFGHLVSGPTIDGTWKSKCVMDYRENGKWDLITLTVSGQNVTRLTHWFRDESCTRDAGQKNEIGRFRYLRKNTRGDFEIEYAFKMQNGTYTQYETVNLVDQKLYISNEIGGDGEANVPLSRDGGGDAPSPTPSPTGTPAPDLKAHVPTYGDTVVYVGKVYGGQQTETYTNQGYSPDDGVWTVAHDIEPGTDMGYDYYRSLWSSDQANDYLTNCASHSGINETITVAAGVFQTCLIDNGKTKIWYGNVPIWGFVKMVSKDGSYSSELKRFAWGDSLTYRN